MSWSWQNVTITTQNPSTFLPPQTTPTNISSWTLLPATVCDSHSGPLQTTPADDPDSPVFVVEAKQASTTGTVSSSLSSGSMWQALMWAQSQSTPATSALGEGATGPAAVVDAQPLLVVMAGDASLTGATQAQGQAPAQQQQSSPAQHRLLRGTNSLLQDLSGEGRGAKVTTATTTSTRRLLQAGLQQQDQIILRRSMLIMGSASMTSAPPTLDLHNTSGLILLGGNSTSRGSGSSSGTVKLHFRNIVLKGLRKMLFSELLGSVSALPSGVLPSAGTSLPLWVVGGNRCVDVT